MVFTRLGFINTFCEAKLLKKIILNQDYIFHFTTYQINLLDYALLYSLAFTPIIALLALSPSLQSQLWFRLLILVIVLFPALYLFLVIISYTSDPAGSIIDYVSIQDSMLIGDNATEVSSTEVLFVRLRIQDCKRH